MYWMSMAPTEQKSSASLCHWLGLTRGGLISISYPIKGRCANYEPPRQGSEQATTSSSGSLLDIPHAYALQIALLAWYMTMYLQATMLNYWRSVCLWSIKACPPHPSSCVHYRILDTALILCLKSSGRIFALLHLASVAIVFAIVSSFL